MITNSKSQMISDTRKYDDIIEHQTLNQGQHDSQLLKNYRIMVFLT